MKAGLCPGMTSGEHSVTEGKKEAEQLDSSSWKEVVSSWKQL